MKKRIISLVSIICFAIVFCHAVLAQSTDVVYEIGAGVKIPFPATWEKWANDDFTYYYPPNVYNSSGNAMGMFMVYRPGFAVSDDEKEMFLYNYKKGAEEARELSSITRFELLGVEVERNGFSADIAGALCNCEELIIVNDNESIILSYCQNVNYDLGLKEAFDSIISQIVLADVQPGANQIIGEVPQQTASNTPAAPELQHYEVSLGAGYYTIGKDIPAGTYYISTVSGSGNVHSAGGLNEIFGGNYGIPEYNNYKAEAGKILEVSGDVVIFLSSDTANLAGMTPRTTLEYYNWWEMPAGNYTVGIDIPAGPYYVTAVEGSGNAHISDRGHDDGDLNEIFAVTPEYNGYITSFNNLYLYEGNVIEITSTLRLHFDQIGE